MAARAIADKHSVPKEPAIIPHYCCEVYEEGGNRRGGHEAKKKSSGV